MIPPKLFSHAHPRAHFCYQLCFHKPALYRTLFRAIIASRNLHVKIFDQILNIIFVLKSAYYKGRRGMAHAFRRGGDPSASGFPYPGVQISPSVPSRKIHRKNDAADSVEVNTTIEAASLTSPPICCAIANEDAALGPPKIAISATSIS